MSDLPGEHHVDQKIRVLICDDHELIRHALHDVISREPDMVVCGQASDGEEAIALADDLRPDALIMDIEMPRLSGIEATRRIKESLPQAKILALTIHDDSEYILQILEAGATSYITKGIITKTIPNAIRAIVSGESILSSTVLNKLLKHVSYFYTTDNKFDGLVSLTDREKQILALVAKGYTNKSVGNDLNLTENTVKKYMAVIFEKLGVHSRVGAVLTAQQSGLLRSDV